MNLAEIDAAYKKSFDNITDTEEHETETENEEEKKLNEAEVEVEVVDEEEVKVDNDDQQQASHVTIDMNIDMNDNDNRNRDEEVSVLDASDLDKRINADQYEEEAAAHTAESKPGHPKFEELTLELPRDILTAYFLIRSNKKKWTAYSLSGKITLWAALFTPFIIQFLVLSSLLSDMDIEGMSLEFTASAALYNLSGLAVLFIYMIRDVTGLYHGLWKYLNHLEKKAGAKYNPLKKMNLNFQIPGDFRQSFELLGMSKQETRRAGATTAIVTVTDDEKDEDEEEFDDEDMDDGDCGVPGEDTEDALQSTMKNLQFVEFRVWFMAVMTLYLGFSIYSIVQIGTVDSITDKLNIAIGIFFVLEIDDWVYELFIAQNNILNDDAFDVTIKVPYKEILDQNKVDQKKLQRSLMLLFGSIGLIWAISIVRQNF